jgi:cellulase/cellobiase CelA1
MTPPVQKQKPELESLVKMSASIVVKSSWQSGFCADLIVENKSDRVTKSWKILLNPNGAMIDQSWNIKLERSGENYVITPKESWNKEIPARGELSRQGLCATTRDPSQKLSIISVSEG